MEKTGDFMTTKKDIGWGPLPAGCVFSKSVYD